MKKLIQFLLLASIANIALAMQEFKIVCKACKYEKEFFSGNSKAESIRTGIDYDTFFCPDKKEFLELPGPRSRPTKKNKEEIVKVTHSKNNIEYTHSRCKGVLVHISEYKKEGNVCPVCNKGELKIIYGAIAD
jgi:hypothetical protein